MIPILFNAEETAFTTNGLGRLADAIECKVTEERNGSYELEMKYPVDGAHYSDIENGRLIFAQPSRGSDPEPFEIYLITRPLNGQVQIKAEHISYRMKYIPIRAFTAEDVQSALQMIKSNAVCSCPFTFETDKQASGELKIEQPCTMRSVLSDGGNTVTSIYDGEWEFRRFRAILHKARGRDNGVTIRYGKNLTSLEQEENIEEMYSGIYPYWQNGSNDEGDSVYLELPEKILKTSASVQFPYDRIMAVDFSSDLEETEITRNWTETSTETTVDPSTSRVHTETKTEEKSETIKVAPTADSLRQVAQSYIEKNNLGVPKISLKVEFVDLWKSEDYYNLASVEKVNLCDTVTVEFLKLGVSTKAKVTKTEYDVLNERYSSIEIGDSKPTLNSVVQRNVKQSRSNISADIEKIKKLMGKTRSGTKQIAVSSSNQYQLLSITEMAKVLEIEENKVNSKDISLTAENVDTKITTKVISCEFSKDGWYITFADTVDGSVMISYTAKYLGG